MTTKQDIEGWFDEGVAKGATHMIIVCDTYDHDDYPVFVTPEQDAKTAAVAQGKQSMQRVMEVYDLHMDKDEQMAEYRAFHY